MTRLRTLGRQGGFPICQACAKRERFRLSQQLGADANCDWCGQREPSTTTEIEIENETINGRILVLIGIGATSRIIAERLNLTSAAAVRKRVERWRTSHAGV